jgi:hypothetical protein
MMMVEMQKDGGPPVQVALPDEIPNLLRLLKGSQGGLWGLPLAAGSPFLQTRGLCASQGLQAAGVEEAQAQQGHSTYPLLFSQQYVW